VVVLAGVVEPPALTPPELEVPAVPPLLDAPVPDEAAPVADEVPLLPVPDEPVLAEDAAVDVVWLVDVVVATPEPSPVVEPPAGTVSGGALTALVAAVEPPPPHADRPSASDAPAASATPAAVSRPRPNIRTRLRSRAAPSGGHSADSRSDPSG